MRMWFASDAKTKKIQKCIKTSGMLNRPIRCVNGPKKLGSVKFFV